MILPLFAPADGSGTAVATALLIGGAFGFALERAGLGSARKIAAQFYLTDLTVFKMMFTAIVVAAAGTVLLAAFGVLDLSRVDIPATWLVPQLVGGVVFGVGMIVGGLCPGTSCIAAAAGKLDGVFVLIGMIAGTLAFSALFGWLEPLYRATPRGRWTLDELLHLPPLAVVALVILVALAGFVVAERIERRPAARETERA